jgi:hypothetical protein
MQTFILLTRLVSEEATPSFAISKKERAVADSVRSLLPDVNWVANYAVAGPWDYLDVFQAPDIESALKVSALTRYYGGAHTELWPVVEWDNFNRVLSDLAQNMEKPDTSAQTLKV